MVISKLDRPNFIPPTRLLDSVTSAGKRAASFRLRYPKMVHGDFLTHRVFSRNASSSRAIPNKRLSASTSEDMYVPEFRNDRPGMQPGEYLTADAQEQAQRIWRNAADHCILASRELTALGAGKQWANRMIEWFGYINVIVTATNFDNFIGLRDELTDDLWPMAQDEIYFQATAIRDLLASHEPTLLREGEWHLPMTRPGEFADLPLNHRLRIDAARCAGISYETVTGDPMTVETADRICNKLLTARRVHASPFEHQCSPDPQNKQPALHGNLEGWIQFRKTLPGECIGKSERQQSEPRKLSLSTPHVKADMRDRICVFQDWLFELTMQQQSVLVLACRGPDGIAKFHPTKLIVARYRATVLKAAYLGRAMRVDEGDDTTFMTLINLSNAEQWMGVCRSFFEHVDEVPHHYYMHLMHGAQIAGYKHPDQLFRSRWDGFYRMACHDLHLNAETEDQMDRRLSDWDRRHWSLEQAAE